MIYSLLRARIYQPTTDLTATCPQIEAENIWAVRVDCGQHIRVSKQLLEILNQNHRCKLVVNRIPHGAGLA